MKQPAGMLGFGVFWLGQVVSLLGTNMSTFALTIWAYERTGSATALALVGFFYITPLLLLSPLAGALVDRLDRKLMMLLSDLASGLVSVGILLLYLSGRLEIWHLYVGSAVSGAFQAFQFPAFSAAITTMLPKRHYARAEGMMSLAGTSSGIFAPLLAGALLPFIGLGGILVIDILSFTFAILTLLVIHVPPPAVTAAGQEGRGSLRQESAYGFWYILRRPSLLGLQLVFLLGNLVSGVAFYLLAPMILARTGTDKLVYGTVSAVGAAGGLLGGLLMSAWGGPRRLVHGVLGGWALTGLLWCLPMGLGRGVIAWSAANFLGSLLTPIIDGSNQAIWQSKVAPDVQGRVFAIRRMIAWVATPLAALVAGPLADKVFEPAMQAGGHFAQAFAPLVGSGPGAGMALIFAAAGFLTMLVGLGGYAFPAIRQAETILPDYDSAEGAVQSV